MAAERLTLFDPLDFQLPWHASAEPVCTEFDEDVWCPAGVKWLDFVSKPPPWRCLFEGRYGQPIRGWMTGGDPRSSAHG